MSLNLNPAYVGSHWESVEIGAAKAGRTPDRGDWRMVREVFVADTDEEALAALGRRHDGPHDAASISCRCSASSASSTISSTIPTCADSDVTPEYCAKHNWIVGSPKTVAEKIEKIYDEVGGFGAAAGVRLRLQHKPKAWHHSLELLSKEVMPRLKHLGSAKKAA